MTSALPATLAIDEFGRPFIIIKDQERKRRLNGLEAHKVRFKYFLIIYFTYSLRVISYYFV